MARILALLIGLAALCFAAKYALTGAGGPHPASQIESGVKPVDPNGEHTRPRQELDNVRDRSHQLEKEMQKSADDAARKGEPQ